MTTVTFKTEDAIFQFDRKPVMECLKRRKLSYEIKEIDPLLDVISRQPDQTILSSAEHQYFGYIALDLINADEGSVVCKNCGKQYRFNQLEAFTVGPDEITSKVNTGMKEWLKRLFRKKQKPFKFGMYAGKGVKCAIGHTLIFMITWRT